MEPIKPPSCYIELEFPGADQLFCLMCRFTIGLFLRLQRAFFEVTILVHIWLEKEQIGSEHLQTESTFLPRFPTAMTLIINLV